MSHRYSAVCDCGDHGFVSLTRGGVALLDADALPLVARHAWMMRKGYAVRCTYGREGGRKVRGYVRMHRALVDCADDRYVDHINHDRSDNRSRNLRPAAPSESASNRRAWGSIKFKGVDFYKLVGRYRARIQFQGRYTRIGYFDTAEEAARAYDAEAVKVHGQFAKTNASMGLFPTEAA